jgi:hypothetical protein
LLVVEAARMTPEVRVEIAFGFGPYDPEPLSFDWIDVTDDVRAVTIKRGRPSEFDRFPASTCTVTLRNDERQYDPLNSAGTHYGDLLPNTWLRVIADVAGTDYPLWRGLVDGWPAEYSEGGFRSEIDVQCTDVFRVLAERRIPDTLKADLDTFGAPDAWWRFDRVTAERTIRNEGALGRDANVVGEVSLVAGLVPTSTQALSAPAHMATLLAFDYGWLAEAPIIAAADDVTAGVYWSAAFVVQMTSPGARLVFATVLDGLDSGGFNQFALSFGFAGGTRLGHLFVTVEADATNRMTARTDRSFADGRPHVVVLLRSLNAVWLYVDGVLEANVSNVAVSTSRVATGGRHAFALYDFDTSEQTPPVTLDEVMVWNDRVLSVAEVVELSTILRTGFSGERLSGQAMSDVLDLINWGSLRALDDGEMVVQMPANPGGRSALALLQQIADTEQGRLFVDPEGNVTFHARSRPFTETVENTVQYTFSDVDRDDPTPPNVGLQDGTLRITIDDKQVYDAAVATRVGGVQQTATAVADPLRTWSAPSDLLVVSDAQALSVAEWVVFRYGVPQVRSEAWQVDPEVRPADWADILTLDIGHRIKLDLTPGGVGSSINLEQHLSLIEHDIDTERWLITLNGTPVDEADYFLWAASATASTTNGWADTDGDPAGGAWG